MAWRRRGPQHPGRMPSLRSQRNARIARVTQHRQPGPGLPSARRPTAPRMRCTADQRAHQTDLPRRLRATAGRRRLSSHSALRAKSPNPSTKVCAKPLRAPSAACVRE
ncbi:hypothetical protein XavaCFBP5823_02770 [Xanthomonas axonopodis pv. vasculorum]|nr:hypothetical protein XavaCFBP5823_02770 [Xanthomonas axonopodis pv. vasculorum]